MFRAVVVPLDGTEFSARALPFARSLAESGDATIHVIGIPRSDAELPLTYDHVHAFVHEELQGEPPEVKVDVVVDPDPVEILLRLAANEENVLCLASHDWPPPPAPALMHSVGSGVIERASRPLVVVGPRASAPGIGTDVVVALDPHRDPEPSLVTAAAWALQLHAPLRIVTVFEPVPSDLDQPEHFTRRHGPSGDPDAYVASMAQRLGDIGLTAIEAIAIPDPVSAASGLLDHLCDHPARLIVMGTVALDANGTRRLLPRRQVGRSNHTTRVDSRRNESPIRRLARAGGWRALSMQQCRHHRA
jgi:nucleotide-binding universal stress UspA family protein